MQLLLQELLLLIPWLAILTATPTPIATNTAANDMTWRAEPFFLLLLLTPRAASSDGSPPPPERGDGHST